MNQPLTCRGVPLALREDSFPPLPEVDWSVREAAQPRELYAQRGVVLLRGALPRERVLDLREEYLGLYDPTMFGAGGPREGTFSGRLPNALPTHGMPGHPAYEFVRTRSFDRFTNSPELARIAASILDGPAHMLKRRILRQFVLGQDATTPAHYDLAYLDQGSADVLTLWIPIGDCPLAAGPLVYLEDSHRLPPDEVRDFRRRLTPRTCPDARQLTTDLQALSELAKSRWLASPLRAGDVLAHCARTIHAGLDNVSDVIRVSLDIRFVRTTGEDDPRWRGHWVGNDGY